MSLAEYRKELKGVQVFVFALPVISHFFDPRAMVFPPLGDDSGPWKFFAMAIVGASAFLPYILLPRTRRNVVVGVLFLLFVVSGGSYLRLQAKYVVTIPYPVDSSGFVIRGTVRNPELKEPYASMNDEDLIQNAGQSDDALEKAYTKESLLANRSKVFWSYVGSLVLLELMLGSIALTGARSATTKAASGSAQDDGGGGG
jgi:hypothetical protein